MCAAGAAADICATGAAAVMRAAAEMRAAGAAAVISTGGTLPHLFSHRNSEANIRRVLKAIASCTRALAVRNIVGTRALAVRNIVGTS